MREKEEKISDKIDRTEREVGVSKTRSKTRSCAAGTGDRVGKRKPNSGNKSKRCYSLLAPLLT